MDDGFRTCHCEWGFPGCSVVKNLPANAGDTGGLDLIPGLGRSPGEGNGNPLQYSCLETSMDRGAWWAMVHGVLESQTTQRQLTTHACSMSVNDCRTLGIILASQLLPGTRRFFFLFKFLIFGNAPWHVEC